MIERQSVQLETISLSKAILEMTRNFESAIDEQKRAIGSDF
jgi:hypothetical protein